MNPYIRMRIANKGKGLFRAEANTLWLYDVIAQDNDEAEWWGGISPSAFISALEATTGPVTLRINSPGGSAFGAQAMIAAMRAHPHQITARVDSLAASAASVIAAHCASCVMVPGSMLMIHKAWSVAVGNSQDMRKIADLLEKIDGLILDNYVARAGDKASRDDFENMMAAETWFSPEEALAVGLADSIDETDTQRAKSPWDLSAFASAPAALVEAVELVPDPAPVAPAEETAEALAVSAKAQRQRQLMARLLAKPI